MWRCVAGRPCIARHFKEGRLYTGNPAKCTGNVSAYPFPIWGFKNRNQPGQCPAGHGFGTLTAKNTDHIKIFSVPAGSIYFYKFTITAGQQVNISINSTQTNYTVLYENQHVEDGKTMFLYEVTKKAGKSYTLSSSTLAAGTYYISIRSSPSSLASGTLVISLA